MDITAVPKIYESSYIHARYEFLNCYIYINT